jgi:hypothetical protein
MTALNYEMLGRYTEAGERAQATIRERARALYDLKALINGDHAPEDVKRIDWDLAEALLNKAKALDAALREAFADGNLAAEALSKPRLDYKR